MADSRKNLMQSVVDRKLFTVFSYQSSCSVIIDLRCLELMEFFLILQNFFFKLLLNQMCFLSFKQLQNKDKICWLV